MTAWLPAIRLDRRRYWLPLSVPTGDALSARLLSLRTTGDASSLDVASCLVHDPAFFFLSLNHWQRTFAATPIEPLKIRLSQLAAFASTNWTTWFRSGDAFLGAPLLEGSFVTAWQLLYHQTLAEPLERWAAFSTRWLEITGQAVTSRRLELAVVEDEMDVRSHMAAEAYSLPETYGQFQTNLPQLVRVVQRHHQLANRFNEQLESEKRAAVKQFAYGLSHELNNPLANISVRAQTLLRSEASDESKKSLSRILEQTGRAHDMLADLMFFVHPPQPKLGYVTLRDVFNEVSQQYLPQAAELGIELRVPSATEEHLEADPAMLVEAISSLVRNAIEAIGVRGRIDIKATPVTKGRQRYLKIQIADSGPGLSSVAVKHAFDPYFSGREAGRGLGVGLCRAWRIARLHQGTLALKSAPIGCIATLRLPQGNRCR